MIGIQQHAGKVKKILNVLFLQLEIPRKNCQNNFKLIADAAEDAGEDKQKMSLIWSLKEDHQGRLIIHI